MLRKVLNHRLIHKCQKIPPAWLNSSACHSSWQGWELSWEQRLPFISQRITFARNHYSHFENSLFPHRALGQTRGRREANQPFLPSTAQYLGGGWGRKNTKRLQNCIYFTFNSCLFYTFLLNAISRLQHKEPWKNTKRRLLSFKSRKYSLIHWASQGFLGSFYCIDAAIQPLHTFKHGAKFTGSNLLQFMEFGCIPRFHVTFCYCYPLQIFPRIIFRSADIRTAKISIEV